MQAALGATARSAWEGARVLAQGRRDRHKESMSVICEHDVLASNLRAVFCGINRPPSAAASARNFATASNRFWPVLHRSGFTDALMSAQDERGLLDLGYGITAVAQRETRRADELSPDEIRAAWPAFEARIRHYAPAAIGLLGKRALSTMLNRKDVAWGPQSVRVAGAITWVLPNPSGRNRAFTMDGLVSLYAAFRKALPA
jgi:TDG/mug DNA glycosylase family protein